MNGFFTSVETKLKSRPTGKINSCFSCGLYKNCKSPRMEAFGKFQRQIMIIGEAPDEIDDRTGKLMAINAWDENWQYINYRFCIVDKSQPFLDEFTRYLFYTDAEIQNKDKLVNDGGSLNNEGLERFKDKLNPVQKRSVYSWIKNK